MFAKEKILKKEGVSRTETEEEVAKALLELEVNKKEAAEDLKHLVLTAATMETLNKNEKALLLTIPFKCTFILPKVQKIVCEGLSQKFQVPVLMYTQRNIISKKGRETK